MLVGTYPNGGKCIYDVPNSIKKFEEFQSLIYGFNKNPKQREELYMQPLLLGLNGPMYNGTKFYNGEEVPVIRYEESCKF